MVDLNIWQYLIVGIGAFLAGGVNALAGGGTLITFPLLTAVGLPAVAASITNTVALCPGYFGATLAQRADILEQKKRLWALVPASILGGVVGGFLLLRSGEKLFSGLVPWLILLASLLLALGDPLRNWLKRHSGAEADAKSFEWIAIPAVAAAAIYGGYFGAGLSVIILAVLGIVITESLTKLNALKQALALATNVAAAVFFLFSGQIHWPAALVMAICALGGGAAGGKLAGKIDSSVLRWVVVSIGVVVAVIYFVK
jgi:uncharacterized membrane protein YfcA